MCKTTVVIEFGRRPTEKTINIGAGINVLSRAMMQIG